MADKACEDACQAAHQSTVIQINRTLMDGLSLAKSDAEREAYKASLRERDGPGQRGEGALSGHLRLAPARGRP